MQGRHDPILERLLTNMSHELGIPLRTMLSAAVVGRDIPASPDQLAYTIFTAIQQQAQQLLQEDLQGDLQEVGLLLSERFGLVLPLEREAVARPPLERWAKDLSLTMIVREIAQRVRVRLRRISQLAEQVITTKQAQPLEHMERAYQIMRQSWLAIGVVDVYVEDGLIRWLDQQQPDSIRVGEEEQRGT